MSVKSLKHTVFIGFFCLVGLLVSAASQARAPMLKVGISGQLMPLHGFDKGKAVGFEADMARLLAKKLGRKVEFVDLERLEKGSFDALQNEDIDLSVNSIPTQTKVDAGLLLSEAYLTLHFRLVGKKGAKLDDPASTTAKIAVLDRAARDLLKKRMPEARFVPQSSIKAAVAALMRGEVQFIAHDVAVLSEAIKGTKLSLLPQPFGELSLSIATRAADAQKINKLLKRSQKSLHKLQTKWLEAATPLDMNSLLAAWPKNWVGLINRGGKQRIGVRCDNSPDRIAISQRDGGWYLEFQLGEDSVDGRIHKIEKLGRDHYRLHYLRQSIELRYKTGSKTAQWGKSTELWKGAWHSFADSKNEKNYRAVHIKKCP